MDYDSLKMSFEEVTIFVASHKLKLESIVHKGCTNEQMLAYVKTNYDKIVCRPLYYYGDTISAIHIEETINNQKMVSYWNVIND